MGAIRGLPSCGHEWCLGLAGATGPVKAVVSSCPIPCLGSQPPCKAPGGRWGRRPLSPVLRTGLAIEPSVPRFQEQLFRISCLGARCAQAGQGTGLGLRPSRRRLGSRAPCDAPFCGWIILSYLLLLPGPPENRLLGLPHRLPEISPS